MDLQADNDIVLKAATLTAQQNVELSAGRDVVISTAQQSQQSGQSSMR
ncbi:MULTISPECIES: hemagglutinin repeat-containing protein [unclassified Pseudomonas]